jgi:hypothetical protein
VMTSQANSVPKVTLGTLTILLEEGELTPLLRSCSRERGLNDEVDIHNSRTSVWWIKLHLDVQNRFLR